MAVIARINGLVRRSDIKRKKDDGTVFAATVSVLTEPSGDPAEVMAWASDFSPVEIQGLLGSDVEFVVEVDHNRYGLQFRLVEVIEAKAPVPA